MRGFHHKGHRPHGFGRMMAAAMMARAEGCGEERFAGRGFGGGRGGFGGGFGGDFAEGFGGRGFGGGGFGGRGRRKLFQGDQLQSLLLALIAEEPRHGYDLIREIEARSGGVYAPSPGVVYPTLTLLDEMGHIEELKEEGARRRFAITEAGRKALDEKTDEVADLLKQLAAMGEDRAKTDRAPLRRAMMSLHMALREAMMSGQGDRAHDIAAVLDEATQKIERL